MAFGQQLGPPASARQVSELLVLLKGAGHADFRDARGPMGFTQRQAGGRFARDEAAAFIDQLLAAEAAEAEEAEDLAETAEAADAAEAEDLAETAEAADAAEAEDLAETAEAAELAETAEVAGDAPGVLPGWRQSAHVQMMSRLSSEQLAGELRRRGWTITEPQVRPSGT